MPAWAAMRARLWPDADPVEMADELPAMLEDGALWNFILFDTNERAIGMAEVRLRDMFDGCDVAPYPHVEGLWVAPDHRRIGGARALLDAIEARARHEGHDWIGSDVEFTNDISQQWHRANGFSEAARIILYSKSL